MFSPAGAFRKPEAASDVLDGGPAVDQRRESLGLVGRVHGQAVEILGEAGFDCTVVILEDQAGDLMPARQDLVVDQGQHRTAAALASFDLEPALCARSHDQVLQKAVGGDAGF